MFQKIFGRGRDRNPIRASAAATTVHLLSNGEKFELYLREKIADLESLAAGLEARPRARPARTGEGGERAASVPSTWGATASSEPAPTGGQAVSSGVAAESKAEAEDVEPIPVSDERESGGRAIAAEPAPTGAEPLWGGREDNAEPVAVSEESASRATNVDAEPTPIERGQKSGSEKVGTEPAPARPSARFAGRRDPAHNVIDPEAGATGTGALHLKSPGPVVSEKVLDPEAGLVATETTGAIVRQSLESDVDGDRKPKTDSTAEQSPAEIEAEPAALESWDDLLGGVGPKGAHE